MPSHHHHPAGSSPEHHADHHHVVPGGGPVTLDIGGDIGALIAYVDAGLLGTEIHVRADGSPDHTTHTGVWQRTIGNQAVIVAVFPELVEDNYALLDADGEVTERIVIEGGQITEVDLRSRVFATSA